MHTYIIHSPEFQRSIDGLNMAIKSCKEFDRPYTPVVGVNAFDAPIQLKELGIEPDYNYSGYRLSQVGGVQGCFMSHYKLWQRCVEVNEDIVVFEHDAKYIQPLPDLDFVDVIDFDPYRELSYNINTSGEVNIRPYLDLGLKKIGGYGENGTHGMIGTQAYAIKPHAAKILIDQTHTAGMKPADVMMDSGYLTLHYTDPSITSLTLAMGNESLCGSDKIWNSIKK